MVGVPFASGAGGEPAFWILIASAFGGIALSAATRRAKTSRAWKWTAVAFAASGVVAAWLLGVFVPGDGRIADWKYLYYFLGVSLFVALAFRFPRTAGVAAVAAAAVASAALWLLAASLTPYAPDAEVAEVTVYSRQDGSIDAELRAPGMPPQHVRLDGDVLVPMASVISFDDLWPVMGWSGWYCLEGLSGARVARSGAVGTRVEPEGGSFRYASRPGLGEGIYRWLRERTPSLPGIVVIDAWESAALADSLREGMRELRAYDFRLGGDGLMYVLEKGGPEAASAQEAE